MAGMRTWSIPPDGPFTLRLAADARFCTPDYTNDHIWELRLGGGEPPALALETTYGLRARAMRLFPAFLEEAGSAMDPEAFASPPVLQAFLPNYLRLAMEPLPGLEVTAEYWVPDSHSVGGRFVLTNRGEHQRSLHLRLHALLRPQQGGEAMGEWQSGGVVALAGRTGGLVPVVFLAGGARVEQAAYPALVLRLELRPGERRAVAWAQAAKENVEASFEAARAVVARPWEAEIARLEMANSGLVEVRTGEPDWDAVLAFSQKVALGSFLGPTRRMAHPSFVLARLPDRGHSARGDGRDYDPSWDGQPAHLAYLMAQAVLPTAPDLAKGLLRNFLAAQNAQGAVDGKPGLAGQRSGFLAMPLLASLAWRIFEATEDRAFLEEVFPRLRSFMDVWFHPEHDRDEDGHPEWDHTVQAGFEDWPAFVRWHRWGQGLDVTKAETPDLAAYLYRELKSLEAMARILGRPEVVAELEARAASVRDCAERGWSEKAACYLPVDRERHASPAGRRLGRGRGEFALEVDGAYDPEVRVLVRCRGAEGLSHAVQVFIHGRSRGARGRVERLTERNFQWFWDLGTATSEKTYAEIERVEVRGLSEKFHTEVRLADFTRQDHTCLLPLWGGFPEPSRLEALVRKALLDERRFWRTFGVPGCSARDRAYRPQDRPGAAGVGVFWNLLFIEGLLEHGYRQEAAELLGRLLNAAAYSLRRDKAFRAFYHPDEPGGMGERDYVGGLIPVNLFLRVIGVRLLSPRKVGLEGRNPFPWPVEVCWRGISVRREGDVSTVRFPNGAEVTVEGEAPRWVEWPEGE